MSAVIGWLIPLVLIGSLIDALRFPDDDWKRAGRNKPFWLVFLFFLNIFTVIPYLIFVRPRLKQAQRQPAVASPGVTRAAAKPSADQLQPIAAPVAPSAATPAPSSAQPQADVPDVTQAEEAEPKPHTDRPTAVILPNRSLTQMPILGMACDDKEIPHAVQTGDHAKYWLSGRAVFEGTGWLVKDDRTFEEDCEAGVVGTAALITGDGHLAVIVSPDDATAPAVWVSVPLERVLVTAKGSQGVINKRPDLIRAKGPDWELGFAYVSAFDPEYRARKASQENGLLAALGGMQY